MWSVIDAPAESGTVRIDRDEIRRAIPLLISGPAGAELRGLPRGGCRNRAGCDVEGILEDAERLDMRGAAGVYYVLNPLPMGLEESANDGHPLRRRWILVDIDPPKGAGVAANATDAEKGKAEALAARVEDYLGSCGWPDPVRIDSGNGRQLLYACDLPNDEESKLAVKALLRYLAGRFDSPGGAKIDTSVYNASRVAKLPGTVARKGPHSAERPHRVARLLSGGAQAGQRLRLGDILLATKGGPVVSTSAPAKNGSASWSLVVATDEPTLSILNRVEKYLAKCPPAVSGSGGSNQLMSVARAVVHGFGLGEEEGYALLQSHYNQTCVPPWSEGELRHKCRDAATTPDPVGRVWGYLRDEGNDLAAPKSGKVNAVVPPFAGPVIYRADRLVRMEIAEPRWVIKGLLSEGLTILAGAPKLGKSWMALNLALTVAYGGKALGEMPTVVGDVLYLSLEDRLRRVKDRTQKVLAGMAQEAPKRLFVAVDWRRQDQGGVEDIVGWCGSVEKPSLVIIDVWQKFRVPGSSRGSAYEQDYGAIAHLKGEMDKLNVSVLLIHHTKKMKEDDQMSEVSGTQGLAGGADGAMILTRARSVDEGEMFVSGRDHEERKIAVKFDKETFCWSSMGLSEARVESVLGKKIIDALKAAGPSVAMFPKEIASAINAEKEEVAKLCSRLLGRKIVERVGHAYRYPLDDSPFP